MALEREMDTFRRELPALLASGKAGQFVLIHEDELLDLFPTQEAALEAGYERVGLDEAFLVKEVVEHEEPRYFSRNLKRCP